MKTYLGELLKRKEMLLEKKERKIKLIDKIDYSLKSVDVEINEIKGELLEEYVNNEFKRFIDFEKHNYSLTVENEFNYLSVVLVFVSKIRKLEEFGLSFEVIDSITVKIGNKKIEFLKKTGSDYGILVYKK